MIDAYEIPVSTKAELENWLVESQPGDRCIYHRGHLAADKAKNENLASIAALALSAAGYAWGQNNEGQFTALYQRKRDRVHLAQRRLDAKRFEYLAVKK